MVHRASRPGFPETPQRILVLVAAGHTGTRVALETLLNGEPDIQRARSTPDLFSTIRALRTLKPTVLVVDHRVLGGGVAGLAMLAAAAPATVLVMVGMEDHPRYAARARAEGAAAYIRLEAAAERLAMVLRETVSAGSAHR